jgi:cytoskeletal protein CcmA (bactofilin family)
MLTSRSPIAACSPLVLGLLFGTVWPLAAAEVREHDSEVLVKSDETIADDLYAFGQKVKIEGTIQGDLIAFGQEVVIDGTVEGDVIAFGQQVRINGTVKGDIMGAGQAVILDGAADDARIAGQILKLGSKAKLAGSVLAAGYSLESEKDCTIARDALFAGFQALLAGQIDQDLRGGLLNCRLEGKVGGDVDLDVGGDKNSAAPPMFGPPPPVPLPTVPGGLTIGDTAEVTGKLRYLSSHEAQVAEGAKLTGGVEHKKPAPPQVAGQPAGPPPNPMLTSALYHLRHAACVALVGLVALVMFPRWTSNWADNIRTRPGASFLGGLTGLAVFIGLLILAVVVIVLAAILAGVTTLHELVPMVIVGGIVGYGVLVVGMWLIAAFLAEAMAGLALGRLALRVDSLPVRIGALLLGLVVITLILSIPVAGPWIGFVVFLFGLGGFCLWLVGTLPADQTPEAAPALAPKPAKG